MSGTLKLVIYAVKYFHCKDMAEFLIKRWPVWLAFWKHFQLEEGDLNSTLFVRRGLKFNGSGGDTRHTYNCEYKLIHGYIYQNYFTNPRFWSLLTKEIQLINSVSSIALL